MRPVGAGMVIAVACGALQPARAGFTETVPAETFMLDAKLSMAALSSRYDDDGNKVPLIDPVVRYEPGGSLQGILTPRTDVNILLMVNQLQYGLLDNLTVGVGLPVVLYTDIDLDLGWTPGDHQTQLGRSYSEEDFWAWAESMGQPKPTGRRTNQGVLSDLVLGLRYRFSDDLGWFDRTGLAAAASLMGALPTGRHAEPEELATMGTSMWSLHSQGELCFHLSFDWSVPWIRADRLVLGVDVFYEVLFEHTYRTPRGTRHPLLLNYASYVGDDYTIDPGDFAGVAVQLDVVPWQGPALGTWLTDGDPRKAERLPPLLAISMRYTFTHLDGSDWESESTLWDWESEKLWLPGYKNTLWVRLIVSLLRVGVPLQAYLSYRNQTWLAGRNSRATDVYSAGLTVPARFW